MLFPSKKKADNFMEYNNEEILEETGKAPVRSYFCELCGGYHVTSNPSEEEGERMDLAIQSKIYRYREASKNVDEIKRIRHLISDRIAKAREYLNFGLVGEAEDLLDICEIDLDDLKKLDPSGVRVMRSSSKIFKLRTKIEKIKEYVNYDESQILKLLKDDSCKKSKAAKSNFSNILAVKRISKLLALVDGHLEGKDYKMVESLLTQCRELINEFSGEGKITIKEKFERIVSDLENQIKTSKLRPKYKHSNSSSLEDIYRQAYTDPQYRDAVLFVIERIELAVKAYEQQDIDSCETHIEIANFLIDELKVIDDNTIMLKNQIAKLTQMIQH